MVTEAPAAGGEGVSLDWDVSAASWWHDPAVVPGDCDDGLPAGDSSPGLGHLARIGAEQRAGDEAEAAQEKAIPGCGYNREPGVTSKGA